jgi:predicted molibdopterin-dependent oxidoreductase YjgC
MIGRAALEAPDGVEAAAAVRDLAARLGVPVNVMRGKGNAFGAALGGLLPDAGPGGRPLADIAGDLQQMWNRSVAPQSGMTAPEIVEACTGGEIDVLYVVAADPATDGPDHTQWKSARGRLPFLVVQDAFLTQTAQVADVVLPALVAPEKDGTVSSIEGRIQRLHAAVPGPGEARQDWNIFSALAERCGTEIAYSGWEEIFDEMRALIPGLALDARMNPIGGAIDRPARVPPARTQIPSADFPFVLIPGEALFARGAMSARSSAIADLAGEPWALIHPDDAARLSVAEGDAIVLQSPHGAAAVRVKVSTAVLAGQVFLPRGYDGAAANALADAAETVTCVRAIALTPASAGAGSREVGRRAP